MASKKTITRIFLSIVIIACVAVLAWLFVSGKLALVAKDPNAKVVVVPNVCTQATVDSYNTLFTSTNSANLGDQLKKTASTITAKAGYKNDPTCEYILLYNAVYQGDAQSAQTYLDNVKQLANSGYYPNTALHSLSSTGNMQTQIDSIKVNGGNPQNESTSGQGRG